VVNGPKAGLDIEQMWSWNVLLRPVAAFRGRSCAGSDLDDVPGPLNAALTAVIVA